uniref:Uncharacterized protein n=1 Tax=Solanum lycopersicum TaxID=4081 RepID=A0A3Q7IH20_SOLLC
MQMNSPPVWVNKQRVLSSLHTLRESSPCLQESVLKRPSAGEGHMPRIRTVQITTARIDLVSMSKAYNEEETCHDSRDSWGNSSLENCKSIISNLLWSGVGLAFSTRSDHTWLEENTLKHDIVLS